MTDRLRHIWNTVTTVLLVVALVLAMLLAGVRLFGITPYAVLSGSMEPTYRAGALLYVAKTDPLALEVGDPVTFLLNEDTVATHRVVEVIPDANDPTVMRYRTKGDANAEADCVLLHSKNVLGKPLFSIPFLGYFTTYIQTAPGYYIMLIVCFLVLIAALLPGILPRKGEDPAPEERKKETNAEEKEPPMP